MYSNTGSRSGEGAHFTYGGGSNGVPSMQNESTCVIDLRSDTVTRPTPAMKHAMVNSALGDDVYGEDPTVRALESRVAGLLGKQAALFVPSGTMANLLSIMVHCNKRGSEVLCGDMSHVFKYEQGGAAHVAGAMLTTLRNAPDGTWSLREMEERVRGADIHEPLTTLVVVENTHNMCGGKVIPMSWLEQLAASAQKHSLLLHMDGARLFNASEHLRVEPSEIVRHFHSVSVCFSKALAAPVGSALVGTYHFIDQARRLRKMLGGGMRQAGVLAAAALVSLDELLPKLREDHRRAALIAREINELGLPFSVDIANLHTNIVMLDISPTTDITADQVVERLGQVSSTETRGVIVKSIYRDLKTVRLTLHYEITDDLARRAADKIVYVLRELCSLNLK